MSFFLEIASHIRDALGCMLLWSLRAFISLKWLLESLNEIGDITFNLLKIVASLLLLAFLILMARRIYQKEGLVIMPFETSGDSQGKYSGKLVSDLLTCELQRILKVHTHEFEEISIKTENLRFPRIVPKSETLDFSIDNIGTVGYGSTTISVGSLIVAFKRFCPGSEPASIITGSLGCFGSVIEIAACLEGKGTQAWEVRQASKAAETATEEYIPNLIKDLAFEIAFDISKTDSGVDIPANTWRGFMYLTEALEAYYNYMQTGKSIDLKKSKRSCIRAVYSEQKYGKAVEMLNAVGYVYAEKEDYIEAQKIFKIVRKFVASLGCFGLGFVFARQKKNDDALIAFEKAIELNPQYSDAWNNKGVVLEDLKRPEEALVAYGRAIELDPQDPLVWINKGLVLEKLNQLKDALAAFERAIKLNPSIPDAWYNKGLVLVDLNRLKDALAAFERAIKLNPQYSDAWNNKGSVLVKLDRPKDALAAYEKAIEFNPQSFLAWNNKGVVLEKLNRPDEALAAFEKAIKLNPQSSKAWFGKSSALKMLHREKEAEDALSKAKELGFDDDEASDT
jgi:tetratricopeptide (TPR) repeat protein